MNVRVERLREVESLARKEILVQRTPTQIEYYAVDQWAAAPGELISQKLEAELGPIDGGDGGDPGDGHDSRLRAGGHRRGGGGHRADQAGVSRRGRKPV